MSVFKKICSLLFEETETEVIAEDELETISFREPKETKIEKKEVEEKLAVQKPVYREETTRVVKEEVPSQPVEETKKKFVSINLDEKPVEQAPVRKEVQRGVPLKKAEAKDYEYTPVISPMFGAKEEKKKVVRKEVSVKPKQSVKKPNPLGTIISPYFGLRELEEFEEEAKEEIASKEKEKNSKVIPPENEVELQAFELQEEKDIHNVSLDELLAEEYVSEEEEDVMQISLFGESAPIRKDDTISFRINDKEK